MSDFPLELKAGEKSECKWIWLLLVTGVCAEVEGICIVEDMVHEDVLFPALCSLPYLASSSKIKGWCQVAKAVF